MTAVVNFSINVACIVYFKVKWGQEDDINAIYQSNCSRTEKINTGLHVIINILSTLHSKPPICACNYGRRVWLEIGVPSIRNLKHIHKTRLAVLIILRHFL